MSDRISIPESYDAIRRKSSSISLESRLRDIWEDGYSAGFHNGHAAGYAARDKLSCANCGDGGKPVDRG